MAYRAPAPFSSPISGSVEQRLHLIIDALNKKADQTLQPVYNAVQLVAEDGSVWLLTVSPAGALAVAPVPR